MTRKTNDMTDDETLTYEQLLTIAHNSRSPAVKEALKKLEFVARLSHTQEELERLARETPFYNVRIGIPVTEDSLATYRYAILEIQGNNAVISYNHYEVAGRLTTEKENVFYMGSLR